MLTPVTSEVHGLFCQSRAAQAASDGQLKRYFNRRKIKLKAAKLFSKEVYKPT